MFLVDCTGSMSTWINAVKKELKDIVIYILDSNPYADIQISFVGYRDIKDSVRFEIMNFTSDIDSLVTFIDEVQATGGGDTAEDIAGGLNQGLSMNWREKSAKYAILIADAPCHGKKYHNYDDDYPEGDPNGLIPEHLMSDFGKKDITFYAIKIKTYTDKMFDYFNDAYVAGHNKHSPIVYASLGSSTEQFGFVVSIGSNTTLNQVTVHHLPLNDIMNDIEKEKNENNKLSQHTQHITEFLTRIKNSQSTLKRLVENEKIMRIPDVVSENRTFELFLSTKPSQPEKAVCHSFIIKKDRYTNINWKKPFISHYEVETESFVDSVPFNEGAERLAYYLYDDKLKMNFVAKRKRIYSDSTNTIEFLSKDLESITICHHISNEFNERIVNHLPKNKTNILLNFIHCYIYEFLPSHTLYSVENYIPGKYVKYNNNAGWISDSVADQTLIAQAFSHFSYQFTEGYLIIVDLQGVGGYLTDPQIHCLDGDKFGQGNLGYTGIVKFFLTHKCNKH